MHVRHRAGHDNRAHHRADDVPAVHPESGASDRQVAVMPGTVVASGDVLGDVPGQLPGPRARAGFSDAHLLTRRRYGPAHTNP